MQLRPILIAFWLTSFAAYSQTASLVAEYTFQNALTSSFAGGPALIATDPANRASFIEETIGGVPRIVYQFGGTPENQGGLSLVTTDLLNPNAYSIEMLFTFTERNSNFRRVLDNEDRTSDRGLYVNVQNRLEFSRLRTGTGTFTNGQYQHVVMTVSGNQARVYLNGQLDIDLGTSSMNITNARRILHFFLDNTADTSRTDYSSGRIALLRAYTNALSAAEVAQIFRDPFASRVGRGAPSFQSSGVRNGATFAETNPIAPGAFFSVFGASLAEGSGDWSRAFTDGVAPTTLNGTRILINDRPAFLSFTSPGQVNAIAPSGIPAGPVSMVVEVGGVRSQPVTVTARALNPAFFTYDQRQRRFIAALTADNSAYVAPANLFGVTSLNGLAIRPARPNEFVIAYAMGLGETMPDVAPGRIPAPRDGGYPVTGRVTVRFGSRTIAPLYVGLSGFAGVYLVGFQVPDVADSDYELQITVNDIASPTGVVIPVAR